MAERPRLSPSETAAINEACHWFFRLREGERTQADLDQWLASHPRHRQAWQWVTAAQQRFEPAHATEIRQPLIQMPSNKRNTLKAMALLAGLGGLGWSAMHWKQLPGVGYDLHAGVGQIRQETLPDGSRIWLDTQSSVDIAFDTTLRRIIMGEGRILIQTAQDPTGRPFVVDVPAGRITALGTRFGVTLEDVQARVAVYESAVQLDNASPNIPTLILDAGQQARFLPGTAAERLPVPNEARDTAWTRKLLVANDMPLQAFLDELSRYRRGVIRCEPSLRHLKLVGIYPLDNTDAALDVLTHTLPVRIERPWPLWVTVTPGTGPNATE